MTPSRPTAQSPADRRAAEAELRTLVARFASGEARLVQTLRRSLRRRLPAAQEVVYEYAGAFVISFSPSGKGYDGVLSIRGSEEGVRLYFNPGKGLPDPEKLLKGAAGVRWIEVDRVSTLARAAVKRLIDAALERNKVPFARSGKGTVVVRATAARRRGGRSSSG